ncbi:Nucleotide exchange factor SIL1 [Paramyrothecium foliicola]|nr:Nucleotide exchange factor SIL1 [Paramyrothecium foliicola]
MARSRPTAAWATLLLALTSLALVSSLPLTAASQNTQSSKPDLICHTSDPKDCYPRIFEPTDEFQIVHDDQELPNGLHIRLNVWTGKREAKINVPDEQNPALEGLPVDSAVVLVDPEQPEVDTPVIPKGAPAYEPVGKIKEPEHGAQSSFTTALELLKSGVDSKNEAFDDALDSLEEISHDLYYGLKIAEDLEAVKALLCLMADQSQAATEGAKPWDHQAAMILSGALQNNPSALKEVTKVWPEIMAAQCPRDGAALNKSFYSSFVPVDTTNVSRSKAAALMAKAKVATINGLIKDDSIREEFMKHGGMGRLLEVLVPEGQEWAGAQRKVGQLVLDNFLDADMGAKLGQWPTADKLEDAQCQAKASSTEEGCWDYHVGRILAANKGDDEHWSKDVHDRMAALREQGAAAQEHVDL